MTKFVFRCKAYQKMLQWKLEYTFPDGNKHNYEVDFLLSHTTKICPIEVKSEGYNTHRSLDEFCKKFSSRVGNRSLVYTKDLRKDGETLLVPVHMTGML